VSKFLGLNEKNRYNFSVN